jgi:hypothetical protein
MTAHYTLEIYEPGSTDEVCRSFEDAQPFGAISKGDILNLATGKDGLPDLFLRVVQVEHILWDTNGHTRHKICVFTEAITNTREARLGASTLSQARLRGPVAP